MEHSVPSLDGSYEILYILSDKDLEHEGASFFEENIGYIENGEVDFDRSVLVYSGLTGGSGGDIRGQAVEFICL